MLFLKILKPSNKTGSLFHQKVISNPILPSILFLLVLVFSSDLINYVEGNDRDIIKHSTCPVDPVVTVLHNVESCEMKKKPSIFKNKYTYTLGSPNNPNLLNLIAEDEDRNIILISHCGEVSLSCWAARPVVWDFDGTLSQFNVKSVDVSRISGNYNDSSSSDCYNAILTLTVYRKFTGTGRYTCSELTGHDNSTDPQRVPAFSNNDKTKTSIYLFKNENQSTNFLKKYSTTNAFMSLNELVVPCKANSPNFMATLEKKDSISKSFQPIDPATFNVSYDPRIGFHLTARNDVNFSGEYKCTQNNDINTSIVIDIVKPIFQEKPRRSSEMNIKLHKDMHCWGITCSSESRNITPAKIYLLQCLNGIHCDMMLKVAQANFTAVPSLPYQGDDSCGTSASSDSSKSVSFPNKLPSSGMILCLDEVGTQFQYLQFWTQTHDIFEAETLIRNPGPSTPTEEILILELSKTKLYVNETFDIDCYASDFVFANGIKWAVIYSNGSVQEPEGMEIRSSNVTDNGMFKFTWTLNVTSADIQNYVCRASLWNSSHWLNSTKLVKVIDGKAPLIIRQQSSQPEEHFYDDDVNAEIRCEAWGIPPPDITWYKDDIEFIDDSQNANQHFDHHSKEEENITISTLMFKKTSSNGSYVSGTYTCNATNPKGTVLYGITVKVYSYPTWIAWTTTVGAVLSILVAILIFYLHKFWRKSEDQEKYIHQLTSRDIDLFKFGRQDLLRRHATLADLENTVNSGRDIALILPYQNQYEVSEEDVIIDENSDTLGEGHYGKVVHGKYKKPMGDMMDVAVKMLKVWNPSQAKALLDELKILTYVGKHDHVVSLVGAVTNIAESKIQVILEYCAEGGLDKYLKDKRNVFLDEITNDEICFSVNTAVTQSFASSYVRIDYAIKTFDLVRWAYQVACGMQYLASRKIIHGDLAARNLLLTDTRDLKISDFGLSKKIADTQDQYIPTSSLQQDQPWRSLAPEWFENKILSSATDVWAYGVTLWEIFSLAENPYPKFPTYSLDFVKALQDGHRNQKPRYANSYIYDIMKTCWAKEPNRRPSSTDLTRKFFDLLPKNYVTTIDARVYEPQNYVAPNLAYILHNEMEQFQIYPPAC